ncbi:carbonic anhydrase 12, partial [Clarias gariepinus]|uniref:carbonic anhydrase 12 n=1 Tax=Clarias gariepinus TaxID=13013 RepID=UPI00234DE4BA
FGPEGEHHWSKNYPYCGGTFQSPINFQSELVRFDPDLLPIQLQDYNLSTEEQLTLSNNGHSVQLSLPSRMHLSGLPHRYSAAQLHFHWGSSNTPTGSEHTVDGKQFAAEMHLVHFNSAKYPNISAAVDKSDGLFVLGVFIQVGEVNPAFDRFLKYVKGIKYKGQKVQVAGFNIRELLPARLDEYYRYDGSLTTPPCYPSVIWTVFRNPVSISLSQYLALATDLFSSHAQEAAPMPLHGNYRKSQLMDNRVVLASFQHGWELHGATSVASPMQRRLVIQQLLTGDLADLADEGLHHLLPKLQRKPVKNWRNNRKQQHLGQVTEKRQKNKELDSTVNKPSVWKNTHASSYMGMFGTNDDDVLCFISLEKNVSAQLRRHHADAQMIQALRKAVFPQLNLKSYLNCRSDLDLQTIRHLLHLRPTDEANELDQALTKVSKGHKQRPITEYQGSALTKLSARSQAAVLKNSHNMVATNHRLQPMEWED